MNGDQDVEILLSIAGAEEPLWLIASYLRQNWAVTSRIVGLVRAVLGRARWQGEFDVNGPLEEVGLLDATWQDTPEWGTDPWVAVAAPSLLYHRPPYPGLLVRVGVAAGSRLRVFVRYSVPVSTPTKVFETELIVGDHGLYLELGRCGERVRVPSGNYPIEVWVEASAPGHARSVALVLGQRRPRRLHAPDRVG